MNVSELTGRLYEGKLSRREAARVLARAGVGTAVMASFAPIASATEERLTFFTWGGYNDPNFLGSYIAKHGGEPNYALFGDEDEAFNKMRAGFTPDAMFPCSYKVKLWHDAGFLAPIDTSLLSNWPDVLEALKSIPDSVIDGTRYFVPEDWGQTSVMFRADLAPEYIDNPTWAILWDEKYAGRLGSYDSLIDHVAAAALYAGVDPFTMDADDIATVRDALKRQMPLLRLFVNDTTSLAQALVTGELVATIAWNSTMMRVNESVTDPGEKAKFVWMRPKEGVLTWVCGLTVHPVALTNGMYEQAHDLIDAMISVESGYYELTQWNFGVANRKVYDMVDEEFLQSIGLTKDVEAYLKQGIFSIAMQNEPEILKMYEEVKAGF
jgi:spermidine/putrescine transport system substrate-binding protein